MNTYYPQSIGTQLMQSGCTEQEAQLVASRLPSEVIIHLYGLRYTGKKTLGRKLAHLLNAHTICEGMIVQAIASAIIEMPKEYDDHNLAFYFDRLSFEKSEYGISPVFDNVSIPLAQLHTNKVAILTRKLYENEKFHQALRDYILKALHELQHSRIILITYGAVPEFLHTYLQEQQVVCEHVLLTASEEQKQERFERLYAAQNNGKNASPNMFEKIVFQDEESIVSQLLRFREGLVIPESVIIDTDSLSPDQTAQTLLHHWVSLLS